MPKLKLKGFLNSSLGVWYPTDCLVAVIDDPEEAARAVEALHSEGFDEEEIRLFLGPEMVEIAETVDRGRGILGRVVFNFSSLMSAEGDAARHYMEEAKAGRAIVAVRCPQPTAVYPEAPNRSMGRGDAAARVLQDHHAHDPRYYRRGGMAHVNT